MTPPFQLRRNKIKLQHIRPPSSSQTSELLLKNAVSKLNPAAIAAEVLDRARPYAKEVRAPRRYLKTSLFSCEINCTLLEEGSHLRWGPWKRLPSPPGQVVVWCESETDGTIAG